MDPQHSLTDCRRPLYYKWSFQVRIRRRLLPFPHFFHPPHPALEACIIIPCKNEEERLAGTLSALSEQVDLTGRPIPEQRWEILLLVNNSSDRSFTVARHFRDMYPHLPLHIAECTFPPDQAHIGHIRKQLMDTAAARLLLRRKPLSLIVSTDADTVVAADWLAQNWSEAEQGAAAIGGRISLFPVDVNALDARTKQIQIWDERYHLLISWLEDRHDPQPHDRWPRHHQHFAGSLAVRPDTYQQIGGLPLTQFLEDVALYEALLRQDVPFRHSPAVRVHTSARLRGRTAVGLAEQLSRWSQGSSQVLVPSVNLMGAVFSLRQRLRTIWNHLQKEGTCCAAKLEAFALDCSASVEEVREALRHRWFGAAWESLDVQRRLENRLPDNRHLQCLEAAVEELEDQFRTTRYSATAATQCDTSVL